MNRESMMCKLAMAVLSVSTVLMAGSGIACAGPTVPGASGQAGDSQRPNIVMLMTDDTGWNDFGVYGSSANLGHPTPNIDRVGQEGAVFTS